jgi:hypothetical protein
MAEFSQYSCEFDGVDGYVDVGYVLSYERTLPFSFSFWMKTSTTSAGLLLSKRAASTTQRGCSIGIDATGKLVFSLVSDHAITNELIIATNEQYNDDQWHHVVWSYDGSSSASGAVCYVNGSLAQTTVTVDALSATIVTSTPFRLGAGGDMASGWFYAGLLDEVSVYSFALSLADAKWIYNNGEPRDLGAAGAPSNIAAWWRMGDGDVYPIVEDVKNGGWTSPYPSNNVVKHAATFSSRAIRFGGSSVEQYITMRNVTNFERTEPFSVSWWGYDYDYWTYDNVVSKRSSSGTPLGWSVGYYTHRVRMVIWSSGGGYIEAYIGLADSGLLYKNMKHYCFTYDGSNAASGIKLYIDGVLQSLTTATNYAMSGTIRNTTPLYFGRYSDYYYGTLTEISIHSKVLSQAEVTWIYNSKVPRDLLDVAAPSNLVGWWRMGGGNDKYPNIYDVAGLTWKNPHIHDSSTNKYHGTMMNMEVADVTSDSVGGTSTKSLTFESDEYVTMGNVYAYERTQAFSISAWVKTTSGGAVVSKWGTESFAGAGYIFQALTSSVAFGVVNAWSSNGVYVGAPRPGLGDEQWHHVAVTYSGNSNASGVKFYVDNVLLTNNAPSFNNLNATIVNTREFRLGRDNNGYAPYVGKIDDASIYNKELSASEISWIYNSGSVQPLTASGAPSNLVGWWQMGEMTVADVYNGTMMNMSASNIIATQPYGGRSQYCVEFVSSSTPLVVGNANQYEIGYNNNPFSVSCWFKTSVAADRRILSKWQDGGDGYDLRVRSDGRLEFRVGSGTNVNSTYYRVDDGRWHHAVCMVHSDAKIYVDGLNRSYGTGYLQNNTDNDVGLTIGGTPYGDSARTFVGSIDDVALYSISLTVAQCIWLYNCGFPRNLTDPGAPGNLMGWWRMGDLSTLYPGIMIDMLSDELLYPGAFIAPGEPAGKDIDAARYRRVYSQYRQKSNVVTMYDPQTGHVVSVDMARRGKTYAGERVRPVRARIVRR